MSLAPRISLLAVQTEEHPHRAAVFGLFDQDRQVNRYAARVGQVEIGCAVDGRPVIGKRRHVRLPATTLHVEDVVGGDAVEPGAKAAFAFERAQLRDDLDEHLLGDLLGVLGLKDHADGDVVNPRLMPQDQLLERGAVTVPGLFDQLGVSGTALGDLGEGVEHGASL